MYRLFIITIYLLLFVSRGNAQKIDSIFVHLYTDSLKKGTYNYINIDGLLSNGRYLPLDTSQVRFTASHGTFYGNNLYLEPGCKEEKIAIQAVLISNVAMKKDFVIYVKKASDDQHLKTEKEIMEEMRSQKKKGRD